MEPEQRPYRLLVVEDTPSDTLLLRYALDQNGVPHELTVLDDGEKAIQFVDKASAESKPALIIIDLNLPKRDGIEVLKKYRSSPTYVDSTIAVLTSSDSPRDRQRAETLGADAYLHKPLHLHEFVELGQTIRDLLEKADSPQHAPDPVISHS